MQPLRTDDRSPAEQAAAMEEVILQVRRHWFGARTAPLDGATAVVEPTGQLLMFVEADPVRADRLAAEAARRGAYVVVTDYSRPADFAERLQALGFRRVQRHGVYVLAGDPIGEEAPAAQAGPLSGLLGWLRPTGQAPVEVRQIGGAELVTWNRVCWTAFGRRGAETVALEERRRAFASMGPAARWYLATVGGDPAGTAILFQGEQAAQILAVGTLPAYRRRGVASALVRRAISDWQRTGSGFLFLDTAPGSPAERLYLRLGFRRSYVREVWAPVSPA